MKLLRTGAGAKVVGCGVAVEKVFQPGGRKLREEGYRIEALASFDPNRDL